MGHIITSRAHSAVVQLYLEIQSYIYTEMVHLNQLAANNACSCQTIYQSSYLYVPIIVVTIHQDSIIMFHKTLAK